MIYDAYGSYNPYDITVNGIVFLFLRCYGVHRQTNGDKQVVIEVGVNKRARNVLWN